MFEASRSFRFFDYFRVPYRVLDGSASPSADGPPRVPGCAWLRPVADIGDRATLYWIPSPGADDEGGSDGGSPRAARGTTGWSLETRLGSYRLGKVPFFGHVLTDAAAAPMLRATGGAWTRGERIEDREGNEAASIWHARDGSVFIPFDPGEAMHMLWSERYQTVTARTGTRAAKAALLRGYYAIRPAVPRDVQIAVRRAMTRLARTPRFPQWPIETGLHDLYERLFALVATLANAPVPWLDVWPNGHEWALVLTHDVETIDGVANIECLRGIEREYGYMSSWNFVPERYQVRDEITHELIAQGCEIGVHGLRHDGRDLVSARILKERLPAMRRFADHWGAVGFRSPATQRGWNLMPMLGFDYDSSYPDTDPYEPAPGGCCSLLPFFNRDLVELPITLPQDHTLFSILQHPDETLWIQKARHIRERGGMALVLTHPDYANDARAQHGYRRLLEMYEGDGTAWKALPRDVSAWWRRRAASTLAPGDRWTVTGPASAEGRVRFAQPLREPVGLGRTRSDRGAQGGGRVGVEHSRGDVGTEHPRGTARAGHVAIVVENIPFSVDHRVRKQATSLLEAGYRVSVITRKDPGADAYRAIPGLRVLEYPSPPESEGIVGYAAEYGLSFAAAAAKLTRLHRAERVDVVQFCQPPDIYFPLAWSLRSLGVAVLIDQRDLLPELFQARYGPPSRAISAVLGGLERMSQRAAHHTLCVNGYLRERALASGAEPRRVTIVRNGPVLRQVGAAAPDDALRRGRRYLACWVGVMGRQDRLDLLVRALHHLVFELGRTDTTFAILGDGESFEATKVLTSELGLEPWVEFTGWIPEPVVFGYLATADVGLDASLQFEVSPVKAMEYMAFGVPFVAFDLRETRALAGDAAAYASAGDIEALGHTIHELLSDAPRRRAMGRIGRALIRDELAWDHQAARYLSVVHDLVQGSRRHRRARRPRDGASRRTSTTA